MKVPAQSAGLLQRRCYSMDHDTAKWKAMLSDVGRIDGDLESLARLVKRKRDDLVTLKVLESKLAAIKCECCEQRKFRDAFTIATGLADWGSVKTPGRASDQEKQEAAELIERR